MKPLMTATDFGHANENTSVCVKMQASVGVSGSVFLAEHKSSSTSESHI